MKKSLIFAGAIFLTSGIAIAKTIDFDTSIKWNSNVVERALNKSGFLGSSDANWDVRVTHERILAELLKMESFSVRDATRVCLDKCNMSDFLKNGRGASGKKCPELCSGFADALVSVNNEYTKTGAITLDDKGFVSELKDGTIKIFSSDKKFYALVEYTQYDKEKGPTITSKYSHICEFEEPYFAFGAAVVYETQNNKPVALLGVEGEGGATWTFPICAVGKYENQGEYGMFSVLFNSALSGDGMPYELRVTNNYLYNLNRVKETIPKLKSMLNTVPYISPNAVTAYLDADWFNRHSQTINQAKEVVSKWNLNHFTETSWEKYAELDEILGLVLEVTSVGTRGSSSLEYSIEQLNAANECIDRLKQLDGITEDLTQLSKNTPAEAHQFVKANLTAMCVGIDESKIKCSGDCKRGISSVGKDDVVTCTIGDVTYSAIFDDICQSRIERAFDIF